MLNFKALFAITVIGLGCIPVAPTAQIVRDDDDPETFHQPTYEPRNLDTISGFFAPDAFFAETGPLSIVCAIPVEVLVYVSEDEVATTEWKASPVVIAKKAIKIPETTLTAIPALNGWALAYGEFNRKFQWVDPTDENYGFGSVNVFVDKIEKTGSETVAHLRSVLTLSDDKRDKAWSGRIQFTLLCLDSAPRAPVPGPNITPTLPETGTE